MLEQAKKMPREKLNELVAIVEETKGQISFSDVDMAYFFDTYNQYFAPSWAPEKITCGHCRTKVVTRLRKLVLDLQAYGY